MLNLNGTSVNGTVPEELCDITTLTFLNVKENYDCSGHMFVSSGCDNPERSWFTSASKNLFLLEGKEESPFFSSDMQIGCDWLELHDEEFCPSYGDVLVDIQGVSASEGCCYCEKSCENSPGWVDTYGDDCTWYEIYDEPGCPYYGDSSSEEGISASEVCCKYFIFQTIYLF